MSDARRHETLGGFAPTRSGNAVKSFTTGEAYFNAVADAILRAQKSIFIAGWQVNWDAQLKPGLRLIDALKSALDNSPSVMIYVMPWMSPKVGLNTGDMGTMLAVFQLNAGRSSMRAFCCPAGLQNDFEGVENTFFSHHQKQVVIDNELGFVGGLDLAYGRRDDANFSLQHGWRSGPEVYSSCVPALKSLAPGELAAYVSEADLLKTTLSAGWLHDTLSAQSAASQWFAGTAAGQAVDEAWRWSKEPMPAWLTTPLKTIAAPLKPLVDQAQQAVIDGVIAKAKSGQIKPAHVTAATAKVAACMKGAYLALLGLAWATRQANAELMTPRSQAAPLSGAILREDQPRQPWQDVHCSIEGPSVYDLSMNFIRRWNSLQRSYITSKAIEQKVRIPDALVPKEPRYDAKGPGTSHVRVLRSASLQLQRQERNAMPALPEPQAEQHDIHEMMVRVIKGAEQFVYIENQFFQSEFGEPSVDPNTGDGRRLQSRALQHLMSQAGNSIKAALTLVGRNPQGDKLPENRICQALAERIEHAIRWGMPFHAYIVLPVHPEGQLNDIAIVGQVHWTMQSLVFGSDSLINRVRCALAAKKLCKNAISASMWREAMSKAREGEPKNRPYELIASAEWAPYLTLLNLRTADIVGGQLRTEQIYVHSKLLIADDRQVIMGSANINDRSLEGSRDSELAVYIDDKAIVKAPLNGKMTEVLKFGHELRTQLWRKHLALDIKGNAVVKPASHMSEMVKQPSAPSTIKAIQALAAKNQAAYERAFSHIPRNKGPNKVEASIWPVCNRNTDYPSRPITIDMTDMPFSEQFWDASKSGISLAGIQGFFTALPTEWTTGENNHPDMNKVLLTQFDSSPSTGASIAMNNTNGGQST
jgi:phospholipase D1/2